MEVLTLVGLRCIICGPVLPVSRPDRLGMCHSASFLFVTLNEVPCCVDVLAWCLTPRKVRATAIRVVVIEVDHVGTLAGLRRDLVTHSGLGNSGDGCYRKALLATAIIGILEARVRWLVPP